MYNLAAQNVAITSERHHDIQDNDTQHKKCLFETLSILTLSIKKLSAIMLSVVMLSVAVYLLLC
jgi:hypothetical protein